MIKLNGEWAAKDNGKVADGSIDPRDPQAGNSQKATGEKTSERHSNGCGKQSGAEEDSTQERMPDFGTDPDLIAMNDRYAVVRIGGKTRVVWFEKSPAYPGCKVPVFSTIHDFCAFHAKRKKVVIGRNGKERKIGLGKWWIDHDCRRQFDEIIYAPSVITKPASGKLNLWNGSGVKPAKEFALVTSPICGIIFARERRRWANIF